MALLALGASSDDGIVLFNDAGLVNYLSGETSGVGANTVPALDNFAFISDPYTLYAQPFEFLEDPSFFTIVTQDGMGLHYKQPPGGPNGATGQASGTSVASDGNLLCTNAGQVWDPKTHQLLRTYAVPSVPRFDSVVPDTANGKTFFLDTFSSYNDTSALSIRGYHQASLAQTGTLSFGSTQNLVSLNATQLVRWGTSGFAFRYSDYTGGNHTNDAVLLLTSSIVAGSNVNPVPAASTIAPASVIAGVQTSR